MKGTEMTVLEVTATDTLLEATGLEKTFFSTEPPARVLRGIDLTVRRGEFLAVMGASGSGKSTLLYALSGMDRPTGGRVELAGRDLTSLREREKSRVRLTEMGFVFQQAYLLSNLNIRDNVMLPALKARPRQKRDVAAEVDVLLERFEISHIARHGITEVSGGQLQRAALCRALAGNPSILFADEPTGALNSSMSLEVMNALSEVHQTGTTVVMVTHDPACAARADRVVYLRDGLLEAEYALGRWEPADARNREDALLGWLRTRDF